MAKFPSSMKIGFVRRGYSPTGGAEAYLLRLAQGVADAGHVPVLVGSKEWPADAWPNEFVVRVDGSSPSSFAQQVARTGAGLDFVFSLERIHACDIYRAGDGVHAAWLDRRSVFEPPWKGWTRWANGKHRELLRLEKHLFSVAGARRVVANSRMVRNEIVTRYGYPEERIDVVPNGYDEPPAMAGARELRRAELGIDAATFVALFAGSGWERKGLRFAIEAMRHLPDIAFVVAGRGSQSAWNAPRNVRFLGPRSDLQLDFAAADIFLLPTIYDPFSNACLEALASGLPVITSSANGFSEIMEMPEHGSIVTPGSVADIVAALEYWKLKGRADGARDECRRLASCYSVAENTRRTLELITRSAPQ